MCKDYMCPGPCYDYCACSHCWDGWVTLGKWNRIKNRIEYIITGDRSNGDKGIPIIGKLWLKLRRFSMMRQ